MGIAARRSSVPVEPDRRLMPGHRPRRVRLSRSRWLCFRPSRSRPPEPQAAPVNPAFLQYQREASRRGGRPCGRPRVATCSASHQRRCSARLACRRVALPTSWARRPTFDLRTSGKVSPAKNQGAFGTCWTFATFGSFESSLLRCPARLYDFSEDNVARTRRLRLRPVQRWRRSTGCPPPISRRAEPVLETDDAYGDNTTPAGLRPRARLQNAPIIVNYGAATKDQATDIAAIKDWLQHG